MFFYLYMLVTIMDLLLISGIIPTASDLYPVRYWELDSWIMLVQFSSCVLSVIDQNRYYFFVATKKKHSISRECILV